MGCDIHAFVEVKKNGAWEYCGEVEMWRSYSTFFAMAGVRGHPGEKMCFEPRGIPNDCSKEVREMSGDDCSHTPSWLDIYELAQVMSESRATNVLPAIRKMYIYWVRRKADGARLVFWFDN